MIEVNFLWNFLFAYLIYAIFIGIHLANCCGKKKEQKADQKIEPSSGIDEKKKTQTKKSKVKKGELKRDTKESKKNNEEKTKGANKDEATSESKPESEARTENADHREKEKEKALSAMLESTEVIDEPRKFLPETPEEQEAYKRILEGKMRAAKDNETVEDAISDWGDVQKIEELSKRDEAHRKDHHSDEDD